MSAQHALGKQFQQLDMLRPARDLVDPSKTMSSVFPNAARDPERYRGQWERTLQEAQSRRTGSGRSTLQQHIRAHGVSTPVELRANHLGTDTIVDGHHRTSVAHAIDPDYLVPVKHFSTDNWVR